MTTLERRAAHEAANFERRYTRRRRWHPDSEPPRPTDTICWFWVDDVRSILVFRSPIDPETWLTEAERKLIIATLIHENVPFMTRKGYTPVKNPVKGTTAWFRMPDLPYRRPFEFDGAAWVPVKRGENL